MAAFLDKHFVAIKINAEKGDGPQIAKRYGVTGFPTLVMVDAGGDEIDRLIGYRPPDKFLAEIKPFLEGKSFGDLKKKVEKNPRDFESVVGLGEKYEARRDYDKAEELYNRILKEEEAPADSREAAKGRLALVAYFKSRGKEIAAVESHFEKHRETDKVADHAQALFSHYQRTADSEKVAIAGEYLVSHGFGTDAEFLNNYAWYLATHDAQLERALELAKKAVELSPKAAHIIDTLAEAYARTGDHEKAVETQKRAVELSSDGQREEFEKRLREFEEALKKSGKEGSEPKDS